MKVAINNEIGGFCLPDSAILRLVELGMTHFIQETEDLSGMPQNSIFVWESYDNPGRKRELTLFCQSREEAAKDARVIKVVEEIILSGHKNIIIIEIPDDVEWYIHENEMGIESIHEKHRIWTIEKDKESSPQFGIGVNVVGSDLEIIVDENKSNNNPSIYVLSSNADLNLETFYKQIMEYLNNNVMPIWTKDIVRYNVEDRFILNDKKTIVQAGGPYDKPVDNDRYDQSRINLINRFFDITIDNPNKNNILCKGHEMPDEMFLDMISANDRKDLFNNKEVINCAICNQDYYVFTFSRSITYKLVALCPYCKAETRL